MAGNYNPNKNPFASAAEAVTFLNKYFGKTVQPPPRSPSPKIGLDNSQYIEYKPTPARIEYDESWNPTPVNGIPMASILETAAQLIDSYQPSGSQIVSNELGPIGKKGNYKDHLTTFKTIFQYNRTELTKHFKTTENMCSYIKEFANPAIHHLYNLTAQHTLELQNAYTGFEGIKSSQTALIGDINKALLEINKAVTQTTNNARQTHERLESLCKELNSKLSSVIDERLNERGLVENTINEIRNVCNALHKTSCENRSSIDSFSNQLQELGKLYGEQGLIEHRLKGNVAASQTAVKTSDENKVKIGELEQTLTLQNSIIEALSKRMNELETENTKAQVEELKQWRVDIDRQIGYLSSRMCHCSDETGLNVKKTDEKLAKLESWKVDVDRKLHDFVNKTCRCVSNSIGRSNFESWKKETSNRLDQLEKFAQEFSDTSEEDIFFDSPKNENIHIVYKENEDKSSSGPSSHCNNKPFKPLNLPSFDKNGNVATFIRLFENSMYGATDIEKASTIINCLDPASIDLVMPHLPQRQWTYQEVRDAIIIEFNNPEAINTRKMEFSKLMIQEDETLDKFADRYYAECQYLTGVGALSTFDAKIALQHALEPHNQIYIAMIPAFIHNSKPQEFVQYLKRVGQQFGVPNPKKKDRSFLLSRSPVDRHSDSKRDIKDRNSSIENIVCHKCSKKGHYANKCPSSKSRSDSRGVHHIEDSESDNTYSDSENDVAVLN